MSVTCLTNNLHSVTGSPMSSTMNPDHSIEVRKKNTAVKNQVWCEGKRYRKHLRMVSLSFLRVEADNH
jgi:hypothetical protein